MFNLLSSSSGISLAFSKKEKTTGIKTSKENESTSIIIVITNNKMKKWKRFGLDVFVRIKYKGVCKQMVTTQNT